MEEHKKELYFREHVGKNYASSDLKIIVVGDSHYCGGCNECGVRGDCSYEYMEGCREITQKAVKDYLAWRKGEGEWDKWMTKTYYPFDKIFYGKQDVSLKESLELWDRIVFCNFVQTAVSEGTSNNNYTADDYWKSSSLVWETIKKHNPDIVIVWGSKSYYKLPEEDWINRNNYSGFYKMNDGRYMKCMRIWHPRCAPQEEWHNNLMDFINDSRLPEE